jgi:phenylpropionate dioxygenase-like ring-hydroxylating dioxygenase large terminal subunit
MFLSHVSDVKYNHWRVYPQLPNWALINDEHKLSLVSNVCRHQGSRLRGDHGRGDRMCPFHGWRYDLHGEPLGSGNTKCPNTLALDTKDAFVSNNFVFSEAVDLTELNFVDNRNLTLVENRIDTVNAHWKKVIDLFLDVDHIPIVHPGVYQEIGAPNINNIKWHYKDNASIQLVPRVEIDNEFNSTLLDTDKSLPYSAAWTTIFPYTMIEWQPGAWFITVCVPDSDSSTKVNVYKYKDTRYGSQNWEINSRVWETAWAQDKNQAEQLTNMEIHLSNLEEQKLHFRAWLEQVSV